MKKAEQLLDEKNLLETKINELIREFSKENPDVDIDINFCTRKIESGGQLLSKSFTVRLDVTV